MDRSLRNYVLGFVYNIKPTFRKNLKLRTGYFASEEVDDIETLWLNSKEC